MKSLFPMVLDERLDPCEEFVVEVVLGAGEQPQALQ